MGILNKYICLDLDSDLNSCIEPMLFYTRSRNSMVSFGVRGAALLFLDISEAG